MIKVEAPYLSTIVDQYVPKQYLPRAGIVRGISILPNHHLLSVAELLTKTLIKEGHIISGLCIDLEELTGNPQKDGKFQIYLAESISAEEELIFALLHEIGHVDWDSNPVRRKDFKEEEQELYADFYAFETIGDIHGLEKALNMLMQYQSVNGFSAYSEKIPR